MESRIVPIGLITVLVASLAVGVTFANGLPSSKAAAAVGELTALGKACDSTGELPGDIPPCDQGSSSDTGWRTVQRTFIKTPNGKELAFDAALQCGLVTFTHTGSGGGNQNKSSAEGTVRVRIEIQDLDNDLLPDGPPRYAQPLEDGDPELGVTYCHRFQELSATFQGIIEECIIDGTLVITDECLLPEEVSLLLETLDAHSFNFLSANETSGIKQISVQARATAESNVFDAELGSAKGEAFVGLGSLLVETVRLIQNADGNPPIQDLE